MLDVTVTVDDLETAESVQETMTEMEEDPQIIEVLEIDVGVVKTSDLSSSVEEDDDKKLTLAVEAIVGIAVGGFVFLVAMITIILCCCCCKKKEAAAASATPVPVTMNVVSAAADGEGKV